MSKKPLFRSLPLQVDGKKSFDLRKNLTTGFQIHVQGPETSKPKMPVSVKKGPIGPAQAP